MNLFSWLGEKLADYLDKPGAIPTHSATCSAEQLSSTIQVGDILLVDGSSRISKAIKYLTQSTWSHATLCIKKADADSPDSVTLLEADVKEGVRAISLAEYVHLHTRICRPVGLAPSDIERLVQYGMARIGHQYDKKNIIDLARYLIQTPPVPVGWRRSMISLGSGDPTRAICSSLVAQCFQSIQYPILPEIILNQAGPAKLFSPQRVLMDIQHHSLFAPRDFDISPYFQIVKPTLGNEFDHRKIDWVSNSPAD